MSLADSWKAVSTFAENAEYRGWGHSDAYFNQGDAQWSDKGATETFAHFFEFQSEDSESTYNRQVWRAAFPNLYERYRNKIEGL